MNKNYIYGIGALGWLLYYELKDRDIKVDGIIVSDGYKKNDEFDGVKIFELSDLNQSLKDSNIYLTVYACKEEISKKLRKLGVANVFDYANIKYLEEFKYTYLKSILDKDNFKNKYICLGDKFCYVNPFSLELEYQYAFWCEFPDLVLPVVKNDLSLVDEGPYEYKEVKLEVDDIVLDAGANIGLFSNYAASKECKVFAFEPVIENIEVLKKSTEIYGENIKVVDYALSDKNETIKFYFNGRNTSCSMNNENIENDVFEVKAISIDEFVRNNNLNKVDFIKADIEGAERLMLKGAKDTIKKFGPKIAICTYHLQDDPEILEGIIKEYNDKYVVMHKWKKLFAYIPNC